MIKTKTIETVEEYDSNGKLTRKTITETEETDDNPVKYSTTTTPLYFDTFKYISTPPWQITCDMKG